MQIRLYIDEDAMSRALTHNLRARGVDVTTVREEGRQGGSDEAQLEFACSQGRVLYTCNIRDFYRLHGEFMAAGREHAGIILSAQQTYSIGEQVRRLLRLIKARSAESMHNSIEFLSDW
jgi:hypothetical protein